MDLTKRSTQEVWGHHLNAIATKDMDAFISDFSDNCLLIMNPKGGYLSGVYRGPKEIAEVSKKFFDLFGEDTEFISEGPFIEQNIVLVQWAVESKTYSIKGGVDTFIVEDGKFVASTSVFEFVPKS